MVKRKIIAMAASLVMLVSMAGCSNSAPAKSSEPPKSEAKQSAPAKSETPEASKPAQKFHIKIATANNPGDGTVTGMQFFADEVKKKTNGAVTGEVFTGSQLGSYRDCIDGLQMGSIQMAEINTAVLSSVSNKFAIFSIPYLFSSPELLREKLRGKAADILNEDLKKATQLRVVGWMVRTDRNVYSSKGPINKVSDFKGFKIRTMESAPVLKTFRLLGATPTPIPASERYLALQTKVVDAAENNLVEIFNKKEYEVTKYLSMTGHQIDVTCLVMSEKYLSSLSEEQRKIVLDTAKQAGELSADTDAKLVKEAKEKLVSQGKMVINEISQADKEEIIKVLKPVRDEYENSIGKELYDIFLSK